MGIKRFLGLPEFVEEEVARSLRFEQAVELVDRLGVGRREHDLALLL